MTVQLPNQPQFGGLFPSREELREVFRETKDDLRGAVRVAKEELGALGDDVREVAAETREDLQMLRAEISAGARELTAQGRNLVDDATTSLAGAVNDSVQQNTGATAMLEQAKTANTLSDIEVLTTQFSKLRNPGNSAEIATVALTFLAKLMDATEGKSSNQFQNNLYKDYKKREAQQKQIAYTLVHLLESVLDPYEDTQGNVHKLDNATASAKWKTMMETLSDTELEDRLNKVLGFLPEVKERMNDAVKAMKVMDDQVPEADHVSADPLHLHELTAQLDDILAITRDKGSQAANAGAQQVGRVVNQMGNLFTGLIEG